MGALMKKGLQMQIWEFLSENPDIGTSELANRIEYCPNLVRNAVSRMVARGYLIREGDRSCYTYTAGTKPARHRVRITSTARHTNELIYNDLFNNPESSAREIAGRFDFSLSAIRNTLQRMEKEGDISSKELRGKLKVYTVNETDKYTILHVKEVKTIDSILETAKINGGGVFGLMAAQLT